MPDLISAVEVREAAHVVVLNELVRASNARFVLKGGVNLRLFYDSPRYSQDMDLDGRPDASRVIRGVIRDVVEGRRARTELRKIGIPTIDPGQGPNKDTDVTFRYKFRVVSRGVEYPTKVEVSFRDPHPDDHWEPTELNKRHRDRYTSSGEPLAIPHYTRASAVRQKLVALAGRSVVQARDVFDIHVLRLGQDLEDAMGALSRAVDVPTLGTARDRALEMSYDEFNGQVVEFLHGESRRLYASPEAWERIQLETAEFIDRLRRETNGGVDT